MSKQTKYGLAFLTTFLLLNITCFVFYDWKLMVIFIIYSWLIHFNNARNETIASNVYERYGDMLKKQLDELKKSKD